MVEGVSDKSFRLDVLELELKLLNLNVLAAQAEAINKKLERDLGVVTDIDLSPEVDTRLISNTLPDRETEKLNNKFEVKDFNVAIMNPGGINSKRESILNAVHKLDIRALVISETYAVGKEVPVLDKTMEAFFKNRSGTQNKGGVCIFLEKTLAKHSVVIGKSNHDHEWVAVKINYFSPPVVLIGLYGCQTSKNTVAQMKDKWAELWDFADMYKDTATVILAGDANAAIGNQANMVNNCSSMNTNGKFLLKGVSRGNWRILNSLYRGDQRTHEDRSSDSSRCLDYVITNNSELCKRVYIDNKHVITPYRVMSSGPTPVKKYTDHNTVLCTFVLEKKASVKTGPEPPIIVRNEEGDAKFHHYTGEMAEEMLEELNSGTPILNVLKTIMRKLKEAERQSYLRIVVSSIKRKMWGDNEAFMKLTKDLEEKAERVMKCKTNDKIFTMRGQKLLRDRHEEVTSMINDKGELVENREGILDVLTNYNQKLLSRVPHVPDFEEIHRFKKSVVETLDQTRIEEFNTLTPREYVRAVQRIANKGKNMFKQFLKIHPKLQALFFFVFKRMYEEEIVPECFRETILIALFKKNDPKDPGNYRFLHMKSDLSRLYELLIYMKLETHFDRVTAESQMGGRKDGDTVEHLAMLCSIIKDREAKGEGVILTMIDAIKCFDRSFLSDNHATLQVEGADRKALKVMYKLSNKNKVRVAGSEKSFEQSDGVGQGSVGGARITTSAITESTERHVGKLPKQLALTHCDEVINQQGFVDDVILDNDNTDAARISTRLYSNTLYELAMSAHTLKSVQIVAGDATWIAKIEAELKDDPCILQGFALKTVTSERYLGMHFVSGSYKQTIDKNVKVKCGLMKAAALEIRAMCDIPEIKRFGKAAAQKLLAQSQVVPVCLYATSSWIGIEDSQYKELEDAFRDCLAIIMSVPKTTNYSALLKVNGLIHMEMFIDMVKLKVWNWKMNVKKSGRMYRVVLYEIVNNVKGGLAEDLSRLCSKYQLRDLCLTELDPAVITRNCRQESYRRQWREHLTLKSVPMMLTADKVRFTFYEYPENLSRALIMKELGLLVLKTMQPHKFLERNMSSPKDRSCIWAPLCVDSLDDLQHLRCCPYYTTKYKEDRDPVLAEAVFLDAISRERSRKFAQPMILFGSDHECYDEILDEPSIKYSNKLADKVLANLAIRSDPVNSRDINSVKMFKTNVKEVVSLVKMCVDVIKSDSSALNLINPNLNCGWWLSHLASTTKMQVMGWARILPKSRNQQLIPKTYSDFITSIKRTIHTVGSVVRNNKEFIIMAPYEFTRSKVKERKEAKIVTYNNEVAMDDECDFPLTSHVIIKASDGMRRSKTNVITKKTKVINKTKSSTRVTLAISRETTIEEELEAEWNLLREDANTAMETDEGVTDNNADKKSSEDSRSSSTSWDSTWSILTGTPPPSTTTTDAEGSDKDEDLTETEENGNNKKEKANKSAKI